MLSRKGDDATRAVLHASIVPDVACSRSATTRISVVLPQPDGPMKETNSPRAIEKLAPLTA